MDRTIESVLVFDAFVLDCLRGVARVDGVDIDLRPKPFAVLCHLAMNAGRLVSKQELHEAVWGTVAVSDDSLVQCIRELRLKLGDVDHRLIRTVSRRGRAARAGNACCLGVAASFVQTPAMVARRRAVGDGFCSARVRVSDRKRDAPSSDRTGALACASGAGHRSCSRYGVDHRTCSREAVADSGIPRPRTFR